MSTPVESACAICSRPSNAFNYGVSSCNACKMFFRRAILGKSEKFCANNGNCDQNEMILACKLCRFQKCLNLGMKLNTNQYVNLSDLIESLSRRNSDRSNKLMGFQCLDDPNLAQVIEKFPALTKKSTDEKLTKSEWGFMEQLTTLEFISKFEFAQLLETNDLHVIFKATCFKTATLIKAIRSYSIKSAFIQYPDGESIVPHQLVPFCTDDFLARVQSRLIGKLVELNIKEEEFLLLTSVLVCNPAVDNLSDEGRSILTIQQKIYTSALFQYCLITYQQKGPSRFTELLSVCHVINKHIEDIGQLCFMFTFRPPTEKYKRLCAELLSS
ncbi:Protein CBR-NHR-9 [Caenorhabditis briggsae]|uniref:Uncharacterized protein n=3 Tax=Caenorhabditis briggsae TaxID=6238 RepID=A0AAE9DCV6_CAEBR|nr:Protein CBR-NHR-9 [Caenorhabditis briggsae]ULU01153.1 hypothetical protein L3Y34_001489 [Caenorhabditis briggsae]CAP34511.2 Protein CBR-NHR-9 [Caenorhabditis briggsae]